MTTADEQPERVSRPPNEVGAIVPTRVILYRDTDTAVTVTGLVAFSTGFELQLNIFRRLDDILRVLEFKHGPRISDEPVTPKMFRFAIEYADGRRASDLDRFDGTAGARGIHLFSGGSGGGGFSYSSQYWVSPLPPLGLLALVIEWPIVKVPVTRTEIDAAPILDAAARSERPWD